MAFKGLACPGLSEKEQQLKPWGVVLRAGKKGLLKWLEGGGCSSFCVGVIVWVPGWVGAGGGGVGGGGVASGGVDMLDVPQQPYL